MNWLFKIYKLKALQKLHRKHMDAHDNAVRYGVQNLNYPQEVDLAYRKMQYHEAEAKKIENLIKFL